MIKNLFYFLYWLYSKSESIKNPSLQSFLNICVIIAFNIATLYNISFHFFDISLANKGIDGGFWGLIFGVIFLIINYLTWYTKRKIIIAKYEQMARKEKVRRSIFAIVYVLISLLCFYFTAKAFLPWW
jgi:small neutral amino acid transporter SnatA (MarC family)